MPVDSAEAARPDKDVFAISPAVGGLPRIYVPQSPANASTGDALWRVTFKIVRWVRRQLGRHLPNHHSKEKQ